MKSLAQQIGFNPTFTTPFNNKAKALFYAIRDLYNNWLFDKPRYNGSARQFYTIDLMRSAIEFSITNNCCCIDFRLVPITDEQFEELIDLGKRYQKLLSFD